MSLRLRLRMPSGQSTFSGDTFSELAAFITTTASLASFELLTGFPPVLCEWNKEMPLSEKLRSGDTLVVRAAQAEVAEPPRKASPPPMAESAQKVQRVELDTEDAELQAALAMSLDTSEQQPPASQSQPPAAADDLANGEDAVVRRIIPADNSCLFNAVAYALEGRSKAEAPRLRELIASSVQTDGGEYSEEAVLGQSPASYAQWIRNPEHWGGGIELAILSAHYATEMAAFDVQTQRVDIFGQGCGYKQRILLLYDGIHYDLMVKTLFAGAPEELDVTVFEPEDDAVMAQGHAVVAEAHRARKFTDTANFTLRCLGCQKGLIGEKDAMEHAKATGHTNFTEYK